MATTKQHNELFAKYSLKNPIIKLVADMTFKLGEQTGNAMSGGLSQGMLGGKKAKLIAGLDEIEKIIVGSIYDEATYPDFDLTFEHQVECNFERVYSMFVEPAKGKDGEEEVPINESIQYICTFLLRTAVEMVKTNSAHISGTILPNEASDFIRNLNHIRTFLQTVADPAVIDAPAADPSSGKS